MVKSTSVNFINKSDETVKIKVNGSDNFSLRPGEERRVTDSIDGKGSETGIDVDADILINPKGLDNDEYLGNFQFTNPWWDDEFVLGGRFGYLARYKEQPEPSFDPFFENIFYYDHGWFPDTSVTRKTIWGYKRQHTELNRYIPASTIDGNPLDFFEQNWGAPKIKIIKFNKGKDSIDGLKLWDLEILDV